MNFIEASVLILFIAVLCVPLANRLRVPLEIFLFLGSCLISFIPGLPNFEITSTLVFNIFLPPILFSAAYFTSWPDFKFNLRPILQLAFGLVILTTVIVAIVVKIILPDFSWAESFLLGAIVSPTDATAATSILKKMGLPRRFITLLEAESLVNDATALILYRFSLAAVLYGSFSLTEAMGKFVFMAAGGIAIGFGVAFVIISMIKRISNVQAETVFTFISAFASYLLAERLGFSGVISTVVAGIYFGMRFPEEATSHTRVTARASWGSLLFIINGFIFALIGLELPSVVNTLSSFSITTLLYYGVVVSSVVMLVRLASIYPFAYIPRALFPSIARKDPMPSWQFLLGLGWTGMRGIVSLAAALAIPEFARSGLSISHLDLIVFLTYFVVVTTLIIPSATLPVLIKWLKLTSKSEMNYKMKQEASARIKIFNEIVKMTSLLAEKENIPPKVLEDFLLHIELKQKVIHSQLDENPYSMLLEEYMAYKKLMIAANETERKILNELRKSGEIHDEVFWSLSEELDIEELRAKSFRI